MLKISKRLTAVAMTIVMTMGISFTAMAAEIGPNVQFNGQNLAFTDAKPIMRQGALYVPVRALSDGIGAEISYDGTTKITSITKDTTAVHFSVGDSNISITKNGTTQVTKATSAALNINNQIYVPVRFAEQVFGYEVAWDSDAQTAIIVDKNVLLDQLTGKFTLMDKYMAYSQSISQDNYAIKGTFNFSAAPAGEPENAIKVDGTIGGITNSDIANMNMALKMDTEILKKLIGSETGKEDAVTTALLESLKEINMDIIFNATTGKYYISSSLFANPMLKAMGYDADTWYYFDINELFAGVEGALPFDKLMVAAKSGSFEEYVKSYLEIMPIDTVESYEAIQETINILNEFCGDDSFKKDGNNYTSQYRFIEDSTDIVVNMKLMGKEDAITGCTIILTLKLDGEDMITMNVTQDKLNTTMDMNFAIPSVGSATMNMDMRLTKTSDAPLAAPATGSKVVSISDAFISAGAEEVTAVEEEITTEETVENNDAAPVAEEPAA